MATIESGDQTLIVDRKKKHTSLRFEAQLTLERPGGTAKTVKLDLRVNNVLSGDDQMYTRGDLTTDGAGALVDGIKDHVAGAPDRHMSDHDSKLVDGPDDLRVDRIEVYETSSVAYISRPLDYSFNEDWPEDATDSDKIRWLLENDRTMTNGETAAVVGCSESLVSDVKAREADEC